MKNKLKVLTTIACVMLTSTVAFCQEFIVIVPSTIKSHNSLYPTKAGGSIGPFKISVKNKDTLAWTVSIDKALIGEVETWVSIESNSLELTPGQQGDFSVTITVPTTALDVNYPLNLYFNSFLNSNHNTTYQFFYDTQTIIVDNSVPQTPTFTLSQTSKTISVNNWTSYDTRSSIYT